MVIKQSILNGFKAILILGAILLLWGVFDHSVSPHNVLLIFVPFGLLSILLWQFIKSYPHNGWKRISIIISPLLGLLIYYMVDGREDVLFAVITIITGGTVFLILLDIIKWVYSGFKEDKDTSVSHPFYNYIMESIFSNKLIVVLQLLFTAGIIFCIGIVAAGIITTKYTSIIPLWFLVLIPIMYGFISYLAIIKLIQKPCPSKSLLISLIISVIVAMPLMYQYKREKAYEECVDKTITEFRKKHPIKPRLQKKYSSILNDHFFEEIDKVTKQCGK